MIVGFQLESLGLHLNDFSRLILIDLNRPQHKALGNTHHKLCSYSPEPCTEVYCFRLKFIMLNWSITSSSVNGKHLSRVYSPALNSPVPYYTPEWTEAL